ncbi:MAG: hypothetical protein ACJ751_13755 [Niastella sp.]|jgi:predicted RNA-binding protein with PIN domain|uniref:hypothetical protein n=1 Tax=Niastella sp. TaxID=1869183 RepID=UPI00389A5344
MRKSIMLMVALFATIVTFAQDKMYKHTGEKLDVKIIKVAEFTVTFTYPNETAEQTIAKYAIAKIEYGSGRKEDITEKIVVSSKDDWEKVVILEDVAATVGLKRQGEIKGKTAGMLSYRTAGNADKKSMERLKKEAAELGAPFILLTSEKDSRWSTQSIKKGFAYSYK